MNELMNENFEELFKPLSLKKLIFLTQMKKFRRGFITLFFNYHKIYLELSRTI